MRMRSYFSICISNLTEMAGALSLDDQLLGEKMNYYCSSSEDEYQSCDEGEERDRVADKSVTVQSPPDLTEYSGTATNVSRFYIVLT